MLHHCSTYRATDLIKLATYEELHIGIKYRLLFYSPDLHALKKTTNFTSMFSNFNIRNKTINHTSITLILNLLKIKIKNKV